MFYRLKYEVWPKLKHEWKTAVIAVTGAIVEVHDALIVTGMLPWEPLVPSPYRPWISAVWPVLMLIFRRWRERLIYDRLDQKPNL